MLRAAKQAELDVWWSEERRRRAIPYEHPGVLDVRGRRDFSRFDPRPGKPHFSNFGPAAERRPFL